MKNKVQKARPPIVAILGHVDHGKTTLLDKIRSTNLVDREAGGITQGIGAWQVETKKGEKVTFIDTPGHAAFQKMRERGARVADLVILVVAADDGIMPQTVESLQYIKESKTPFIIAITKTDLKTAQSERVKTQLVDNGVSLEGHGGDIVVVEISSMTGKGVEDLLEMIALVAQMNEIGAKTDLPTEAIVIETVLDRRRGPVVHVVVREGILKVGDVVGTNGVTGRIRGLFDEHQKPVNMAGPGMPIAILGFETIPPVGLPLTPAENEMAAKIDTKRVIPKGDNPSIILKTDTAGSLEALVPQLADKVSTLQEEVGDVSESDVLMAASTKVPIIGFNVRVSKSAQRLAENEHVDIHTYSVIYELLQDLENWFKDDEADEKILGKAEIVAEFPHNKKRIAGCRVTEGRITRSDRLRLVRGDEVLSNVHIASLKKQKIDIDKAEIGEEFGILFDPQFDFQVGDMLESVQN